MYAEKRQCGKKSAIRREWGKIKLGLEAKSNWGWRSSPGSKSGFLVYTAD